MSGRRRGRVPGGRWGAAVGAAPIVVRIAELLVRTAVSSRSAPRPRAGAVVVLGSGLDGDRLTPVLIGRLDRAAEIHRAGRAAGRPPLLVLSGGAKAHGAPSEAAAMAGYLRELGVPDDHLVLEDRSTTTEENLRHSAALLAGSPDRSPVVVVTSDYHVARTAALARRADLRVQVVGTATDAGLRTPALLRELRLLLGLHGWSTALGCATLVVAVGRQLPRISPRRRPRAGR